MTIKALKEKSLPITNSGKLSLFFIGVGSAFSKRHYQTNLLIVKGEDHLMVDCGTKTPQAFFEMGRPLTDIKNFYITHSHADHVGGLEEVMLMNRYFTQTKPNIWITEIFQHLLWDMSIRGGSAFNEEKEGKNLTFGDFWQVHRPKWLTGYPRETYEFNVGSINLKAFRTMHTPAGSTNWEDSFWSTGLILDDRIFFSGDTKFDQDLILSFEERFKFDYLFHDCQLMPPGGVHASIDELKNLPDDVKKKMILMHYGDNWEENLAKVEASGFHSLAEQWSFYEF